MPCSASASEAGPQAPFRITWLATDTSLSFNALATKSADLAITYHPYAAQIAVQQGIALPPIYLWRDAFNLVGPTSNPAQLPTDGHPSIFELFALLFQSAVASADSPAPTRFLSRYDKSANNILESRIWATIGQTPWSEPYSPWYHKFNAFPKEALFEAARKGEYTLVDRGTWISMKDQPEMSSMTCFKEGAISWHEQPTDMKQGHVLNGDALGNPAHALLSPHAQDRELGKLFLKWMLWTRGGQEVIRNFKVNGTPLHGLSPWVQTFFGGQSSTGSNESSTQNLAHNCGQNAAATGPEHNRHGDQPISAQCNIDSKYWII
ncbi:hypothetical protein PMZ80_001290 [Knufia obscura]|uniref:PBP domain-containing protein n=1 Tax=Knufia obscura TaxID=1635080 RepID=A0ABR0S2S8_9EURO|nr:hypothetical protein PMZ80_001290 [Knufia obscura]